MSDLKEWDLLNFDERVERIKYWESRAHEVGVFSGEYTLYLAQVETLKREHIKISKEEMKKEGKTNNEMLKL